MSIGVTISKVDELANTLQVFWDSGAKKYYCQWYQQVIFHKYQVSYFQNLILHFIIYKNMQYIKHLE